MVRVARLVAVGLVVHVDVLERLVTHSPKQQVFVRTTMQDHAASTLQALPTQGKARPITHGKDHGRVYGRVMGALTRKLDLTADREHAEGPLGVRVPQLQCRWVCIQK